jgi:hypothetical protein
MALGSHLGPGATPTGRTHATRPGYPGEQIAGVLRERSRQSGDMQSVSRVGAAFQLEGATQKTRQEAFDGYDRLRAVSGCSCH